MNRLLASLAAERRHLVVMEIDALLLLFVVEQGCPWSKKRPTGPVRPLALVRASGDKTFPSQTRATRPFNLTRQNLSNEGELRESRGSQHETTNDEHRSSPASCRPPAPFRTQTWLTRPRRSTFPRAARPRASPLRGPLVASSFEQAQERQVGVGCQDHQKMNAMLTWITKADLLLFISPRRLPRDVLVAASCRRQRVTAAASVEVRLRAA